MKQKHGLCLVAAIFGLGLSACSMANLGKHDHGPDGSIIVIGDTSGGTDQGNSGGNATNGNGGSNTGGGSTGPQMIEFHIQAGTGTGAWNSDATAVALKVGDTLKIVNDDSVSHYFHSTALAFQHGASPISSGSSQSFVANSAYSKTSRQLYDHINGTGAAFSVDVTN